MGRKVDKALRECEAKVREVERRMEDKVVSMEETIREIRRRNNKQSQVILELREDKKNILELVKKAENSAEERAEKMSSGLINRMRESLLEHSKTSKKNLDSALLDIKATHIPVERHNESMLKLRREYEHAREGIVEVMSNKLKIGVEAAEIKNRLLRGELEKIREEIVWMRGGGRDIMGREIIREEGYKERGEEEERTG